MTESCKSLDGRRAELSIEGGAGLPSMARCRLAAVERFGRYECIACACGLHFWSPREMPDARWYERVRRHVLDLIWGWNLFAAIISRAPWHLRQTRVMDRP
jgi:hypothetical protein